MRVPEVVLRGLEYEATPTVTLWADKSNAAQAELQWRLALPLSVWLLALLAVPLAKLKPRQGRYARVWQGIVIYFVYMSLLSAAKVWLEQGIAPQLLGLWWVHGLLLFPLLLRGLRPWRMWQRVPRQAWGS